MNELNINRRKNMEEEKEPQSAEIQESPIENQEEVVQQTTECEPQPQLKIDRESLDPNVHEVLMNGKIWDENGVLIVDAETSTKAMLNSFIEKCRKFNEEFCDTPEKHYALSTICTNFLSASIQCMCSVWDEQSLLHFQNNIFQPLLAKFKKKEEVVKEEKNLEQQEESTQSMI